jgi:hypothetical protein
MARRMVALALAFAAPGLARAVEVAATDALKHKYSSEIDTLLRGGGDNH